MNKFLGKSTCFNPETIREIVDGKSLTSIANLERALCSLEYVGQLCDSGVDLVFKGGSAVQILLGDSWNRLSVDVDICTDIAVEEIERHMSGIEEKFDGTCFNYESRGGPWGDVFKYYRVTSPPITDIPRWFLLDIQRVKPRYSLTKTPLKAFFYDSDIKIQTPTGSSILGDKMSVIGPSTIGRKLVDSRNGVEYAKHFYDIFCLSNNFHDFSETRMTYESCVEIQSKLRGMDLSTRECVEDAIFTCKIASLPMDDELVKRMVSDKSVFHRYQTLKKGVNRFDPFMVGTRFYNWESMRVYASKAASLFKRVTNINYNPGTEEIGVEEMIRVLSSLPDDERWFMDFEDLRLSPNVLSNWYQYYSG
jgi:hypothetical protein